MLTILLLLLLAASLGACDSGVTPPDEEEPPPGPNPDPPEETFTLRELATEQGLNLGSAVRVTPLADPQYAGVLSRQFNTLVAENLMKWNPLRPNQETFDFQEADELVDFAETNNMEVRGHVLVWHRQLPSWLTQGNWTEEELKAILKEHITTVVNRYEDRITEWDVVNEAIGDQDVGYSLRENIWLETIGPEYIKLAFQWAHQADPDAQLFYNDYGAENLGPKSDAVYELVQGLVEDGVPIHGVGFQMHVSTDYAPSVGDVAENMARLADLGLEVAITEMDVRIELPVSEEELETQADTYAQMLGVCLEAPNCSTFVTWGFTDNYSWVPSTFDGDGAALIFDKDYEPKPAYDAMIDVFEFID